MSKLSKESWCMAACMSQLSEDQQCSLKWKNEIRGLPKVLLRLDNQWLVTCISACADYTNLLPSVVSLGTRPSKKRKGGLEDRLGWKCTLRPECRRASD